MNRVSIVGAGAVGGYVGAHMARAGVDVVLVDAWAEHVQAIRQGGLRVEGMDGAGSVHAAVRALHVHEVQQLVREPAFDAAFIAVKRLNLLITFSLIDLVICAAAALALAQYSAEAVIASLLMTEAVHIALTVPILLKDMQTKQTNP
jgi:2-dehydropantoate 2-reductase